MTGPRIAVLDYGIGNLRSAQKALQHVGGDAFLTSAHDDAVAADAVVLPGVGAFGACIDALHDAGMGLTVHDAVATGRPFLGICVGMQMLFDSSEEDPGHSGLGVIPGRVTWIPDTVTRPQMQWNRMHARTDDPMFAGLGAEPWMYFVHSLHAVPDDPSHVAATVTYGGELNVAFRRGNVFATQFHPEKSSSSGLALLANFVRAAAR